VVDYGCRIGNRVKIHTGVYVAQFTVIEDDVFIVVTAFSLDQLRKKTISVFKKQPMGIEN
jgi:hypothetical protein